MPIPGDAVTYGRPSVPRGTLGPGDAAPFIGLTRAGAVGSPVGPGAPPLGQGLPPGAGCVSGGPG